LAIASKPEFAAAYTARATLSEQFGDSPEEKLRQRSGARLDRQKATEIEAKDRENNDE
jgi:hypothetical protein